MNSAITRWLTLALAFPYPVAHIILGLANLGDLTRLWPTVTAMVLCIIAMFVAVKPRWDSRPRAIDAVIVITCTTAMTILVSLGIPYGGHPGYAVWHPGAIQMLLVTLTFRGRGGIAWMGTGLFVVAQAWGCRQFGMDSFDTAVLLATPLVWVVIAQAINVMLVKSQRAIEQSSAHQQQSQLRLAQEHAAQTARNLWGAALDQKTRPVLELIAAQRYDAEDRVEFRLLEAELRDQIRGRALIHPLVTQAAREARRRGVRVEILDDLKTDLHQDIRGQVTRQLTAALKQAHGGFVNVRATKHGLVQKVQLTAFDEDNPDNEISWTIESSTVAVTQSSDSHLP